LTELAADETVQELPLLNAPRAKVHYVSDIKQMEQAVSDLLGSNGPVAIDAERASGFKYSQRAYLVQLRAKDTDIYLIDPVTIPETLQAKPYRELSALLRDREWILHAATQDLGCLSEIGLKPGAIFDTELAARLAGLPRVGLGALTENLLNFRLAKEHSAADWSTRPLPDGWLNYAALDVDVLHELAIAIGGLLDSQGKSSWAAEEFQSLLSFEPKTQRPDRWRGISGLSKIKDRHSLEIARRLWLAREELAQKMDIAPGRLIPDASILVAAAQKPRSRPELASLKTFSGRASRSFIDNWWEAIQSANNSTEYPNIKPDKTDALPNHRNWINKYPEADRRLRLAKASLLELSQKQTLPLENLLNPEILRKLSFAPPVDIRPENISRHLAELGARGWQIKQTSDAISIAFSLAQQAQIDSAVADPQASDGREEL
jgi:ribonuclease D